MIVCTTITKTNFAFSKTIKECIMEETETNQKVISIIATLTKHESESIDLKMTLSELIHDSLTLMKLIVAIENEFHVFLDDINFIDLYNSTIEDFITYANI